MGDDMPWGVTDPGDPRRPRRYADPFTSPLPDDATDAELDALPGVAFIYAIAPVDGETTWHAYLEVARGKPVGDRDAEHNSAGVHQLLARDRPDEIYRWNCTRGTFEQVSEFDEADSRYEFKPW